MAPGPAAPGQAGKPLFGGFRSRKITLLASWGLPRRGLRLQLDFQKHDLARSLVEHVVLDAGFAKVGFTDAELRLGALAIGRHDRHLARGDRHDDVIHLVDVMAGGAARRQPPLGDADFRGVDLESDLARSIFRSP
jgi:hypothetical protein